MKFSRIRHLLTTALLTVGLLATGSTCYADNLDLDGDGVISSTEETQEAETPPEMPLGGTEALIHTLVSPEYPNQLLLDFTVQDLTSGVSYDIEDLKVQDEHIYRFFIQLFSDGEDINDVEVVLQCPESVDSKGSTWFQLVARDSMTAQPLLIAKIPVTVIGDTPLRMEYLEDSGMVTFCGSLSPALMNSIEDLFDIQAGLQLAGISNRERYEDSEYIPETVVLDFQATSGAESTSDDDSKISGQTFEHTFLTVIAVVVLLFGGGAIGLALASICDSLRELRKEVREALDRLDDTEEEPSPDKGSES